MNQKLAIITPLYYPTTGGVQVFAHLLAKHFIRQGDQVRVYTSQMADHNELNPRKFQRIEHFSAEETKDGVEIRRFPCGGAVDFILGMAYALAVKLKLPFHGYLYTRYRLSGSRPAAILKDLEKYKPDTIFVCPFTEELMIIALKARRANTRLVFYTSLHPNFEKFRLPASAVRGLNQFDLVLSNTDYESQFLLSSGIKKEKIHNVGVGIDLNELRKPIREEALDPKAVKALSGKKYALYVGRKHAGKGVECLIQAVEKAQKECPGLCLALAGETADYFTRDWLPRLAGKDYFFNFDQVNDDTKRWLFKNAMVFSMVSQVDSFGIVYVEAWFNRVPVIGSDFGATRCVIDNNKDGYLIPYNDVDALAEKIKRLFHDPSEASALGGRGYEKALRWFDNNAVEQNIYQLTQNISK